MDSNMEMSSLPPQQQHSESATDRDLCECIEMFAKLRISEHTSASSAAGTTGTSSPFVASAESCVIHQAPTHIPGTSSDASLGGFMAGGLDALLLLADAAETVAPMDESTAAVNACSTTAGGLDGLLLLANAAETAGPVDGSTAAVNPYSSTEIPGTSSNASLGGSMPNWAGGLGGFLTEAELDELQGFNVHLPLSNAVELVSSGNGNTAAVDQPQPSTEQPGLSSQVNFDFDLFMSRIALPDAVELASSGNGNTAAVDRPQPSTEQPSFSSQVNPDLNLFMATAFDVFSAADGNTAALFQPSTEVPGTTHDASLDGAMEEGLDGRLALPITAETVSGGDDSFHSSTGTALGITLRSEAAESCEQAPRAGAELEETTENAEVKQFDMERSAELVELLAAQKLRIAELESTTEKQEATINKLKRRNNEKKCMIKEQAVIIAEHEFAITTQHAIISSQRMAYHKVRTIADSSEDWRARYMEQVKLREKSEEGAKELEEKERESSRRALGFEELLEKKEEETAELRKKYEALARDYNERKWKQWTSEFDIFKVQRQKERSQHKAVLDDLRAAKARNQELEGHLAQLKVKVERKTSELVDAGSSPAGAPSSDPAPTGAPSADPAPAGAPSPPYRRPYHYHVFIAMIGALLVGITIASFVFADGWGQVWNSLGGMDSYGLSRTMLNNKWPANWGQQEISRHINRKDSSLARSVAYDY